MTTKNLKSFIEQSNDLKPEKTFDRNFLGIQLTSSCPVGCEHCVFSCQQKGEDIPIILLLKTIREWRDIPKSTGISLTGGEPFYRMELLRAAIEFARSLDMTVRVVTSAFWATSYNHAIDCLTNLEGLSEIIISIDRFHQRYIPPIHVINAFNAAKYLDIHAHLLLTMSENNPEKDVE